MQNFNVDSYIGVQERIVAFWERHPEGRIVTALASDPNNWDICRYRAEVYADRDDQRPVATGYAFEIAGKGMANRTSHEENCETSAIGRALANLGFATSQHDRPSREEMQKVERMHHQIEATKVVPLRHEEPPFEGEPPVRPQHASTISSTRNGPNTGKAVAALVVRDQGTGEEILIRSVWLQHGVSKFDQVNAYLRSNGFKGGGKLQIAEELENTYGIHISGNVADAYPSALYDIAHNFISQSGQE